MNTKSSALLLVVTTAIATGALAQQPETGDPMEKHPLPAFSDIDRDADGSISITEAEGTWLAEIFAMVDVNEDGAVDEAEYTEALS